MRRLNARKRLLSAIDDITLHTMQQEEYSTSDSDSYV